jgi:fatty acid desaturase
MWFIQHVKGHHCYTNIAEKDPDLNHFLHSSDGAPGYRLHPDQPYLEKYVWWKIAVAYQSVATTMAISFMLLPQFFQEGRISGTTEIPSYLIMLIIYERMFMGIFVLYALYRLTLVKGIAFVLLSWGIHGAFFYTFSQISHCNEESLRRSYNKMPKMEWAKWQVLTALDYAPMSHFWGTLSVGLNNQILHHLFPGVHPCHFQDLRRVLLPIAKKHGVDYEARSNNGFKDMAYKYFRWLAIVNDPTKVDKLL